MPYALALLQDMLGTGNRLFIVMGVITLATLVTLGWRFFVNLFEIIRYPASLKHHGNNDNFFFSLVVVFLGGLIGAIILLTQQEQMTQGFHTFAEALGKTYAMGAANSNYRDLAAQWCTNKLDSGFSIYVMNNLIFFPVVMLLVWLVIGTITFLGSKMFGGSAAYGPMLSTLAYSAFFFAIADGCLMASSVTSLNMMKDLFAGAGSPPTDVFFIVGALLALYGLILFFIGVSQAADVTAGQMIGIIIVLLVLVGGGTFAAIYYSGKPAFEGLASQVKSFDPSKPGYTIPQ
jgi:hypothetical protein